jgi:tRNA-dihydrouridine synthase B
MKIGYLELKAPTVLAPLAGVTNLALRLLAKEAGAGLVCSEMVSACGLVNRSHKTYELLATTPEEKPLAVQLFGSDAAIMAAAAQQVEACGADIVDINCGCSVRKILKSGSGSALMREPRKAEGLIKAVRAAIKVPLTIKMRSGWDPSGGQALELARIAQDCGADALTVHPRTARQGFGGSADWSLIARIKQVLRIPVIGNGDIVTPHDALRMMARTGCDAVMAGRAAMGNPLLFGQIEDLLQGRPPRLLAPADRISMMNRFLEFSVQYLGEKKACFLMRSRLAWFVKGLPQAGHFRQAVRYVESRTEVQQLIQDFAHGQGCGQPDCQAVPAAASP